MSPKTLLITKLSDVGFCCAACQYTSHCGSVYIRFLLPGDGDDSETPSAKKHPLPVAKGTLVTSTVKCINSTRVPCM